MNISKIGLKQEVEIGELLASSKLKNMKIIHDITVELDGRTTQVDLILVCDKGLFVIESKNYRDTVITGNKNAKVWKLWTSKGQKNFYSPEKQNQTHIDILSKILKLPKTKINSVIVFPDSTDISGVTGCNDMCNLSGLFDMINSSKSSLDSIAVDKIYTKLVEAKCSKEQINKHLEKMESIKSNLRNRNI